MNENGAGCVRCVQLGADDLSVATAPAARALVERAMALGANAISSGPTSIPAVLLDAAEAAGLKVTDMGLGALHSSLPYGLRSSRTGRTVTAWPGLPAGAAAARLAGRHRIWPRALTWVRPDGASDASDAPVPSNVIATVRRMQGRPGQGFIAPWPGHPHDPAWAPTTLLPESPPRHLRPGCGFAVNLWLCGDRLGGDTGVTVPTAQVTATVRWADRAHSWAYSGPVPLAGPATIATLPLVRPLEGSLSLELALILDGQAGSPSARTWRYLLANDVTGVAFWSLSIPDE